MKIIGILFVVISAASVGWRLSLSIRGRCLVLGQLIHGFRHMKSELSFHSTPLPQAFQKVAAVTTGQAREFFLWIGSEMEQKCWLTPLTAMEQASSQMTELPPADPVRQVLKDLGTGLGQFDLESQLQELELALNRLTEIRIHADKERTIRCRTYQTLGVCAGLALAILLI